MKAFIRTDTQENPEVLDDLHTFLASSGIAYSHTERQWKDIKYPGPFLYFRNAYLRVDRLREIAEFHKDNPEFPYLKTADGEIISVNNMSPGLCEFNLNVSSFYYEPEIAPLPILIGLYKRHIYARLALNSLIHSLHSPRQKLYIVASQPDAEMEALIQEILEKTPVHTEAVKCNNNLAYSFANFGSKYFGLSKFIHFEEDGILPESIDYHIPYWTNQFNYRSQTADFLSLKVSQQNYTSEFYRSNMYYRGEVITIPDNELWYYTAPPKPDEITPIGGVGCVIDSRKMYKGFQPPEFCTTDHHIIKASRQLCIANVPVYHIGANQEMDYPDYFKSKRTRKPFNIARLQDGIDMCSGVTKTIDLQTDWSDESVR